MSRMKTFFIYFLLFVGLYIVSTLLQYGLIADMYLKINGTAENTKQLEVVVENAKATNVNGYMNFQIKNKTNKNVQKAYIKIDFIDEYNLEAITRYVEMYDLSAGKTKNYKINFKGNDIVRYKISFVSKIPDKNHIINILGWEVDATNVFGLGIDLTNINGVDITQYFTWSDVKSFAKDSWGLGVSIVKSIPLWAYSVASLIILGVI